MTGRRIAIVVGVAVLVGALVGGLVAIVDDEDLGTATDPMAELPPELVAAPVPAPLATGPLPVAGSQVPETSPAAAPLAAVAADPAAAPAMVGEVAVARDPAAADRAVAEARVGVPDDADGGALPEPRRVDDAQAAPLGLVAADAALGDQDGLPFVDRCTLDPEGCPLGVAAEVLAPEPREAGPGLEVSVGPRFEGARCYDDDAPMAEGAEPITVLTTRPATVEVEVTLGPDDFGETMATGLASVAPEPGDPEHERWAQDPPDTPLAETPTVDLVHTCFDVPLLGPGPHLVEVTAVAPEGPVATSSWVLTPTEPVDRPRPRLSLRPNDVLAVGVFTERGEAAGVYPIDTTQPDAPDCAEVERVELSKGGLPRPDHPDPLLDQALEWPSDVIDDGDGLRWDWELPLREGRRYELCIWYVRTGDASFAAPEVLDREQWIVVTPSRHPVRIVAEELLLPADGPSQPFDLQLDTRAEWHRGLSRCDEGTAAERFETGAVPITEVADGGAVPLELVLCATDGRPMPDEMPVSARFDGELTTVGAVPVAAPDPADPRGATWFVLPIEAEVCPACGGDSALVVRVERLPSHGWGSDRWSIGDRATFEESGLLPPERAPQLDPARFEVTTVPGRADALDVRFPVSRPVRADVTLHPRSGCGDALTHSSPTSGEHALRFEGLCAGEIYDAAVNLIDEAGPPPDGPDPTRFGTWGRGQLPFGVTPRVEMQVTVDLERVAVDEEAAAARCAAVERFYEDSPQAVELPDDCGRWSRPTPWGAAVPGPAISVGGSGPAWFGDPTCVRDGRSQAGPVPAVLREVVPVSLDVSMGLQPECGAPGSLLFDEVLLEGSITLDDVREGVTFLVVSEGGGTWEVTVAKAGATERPVR